MHPPPPLLLTIPPLLPNSYYSHDWTHLCDLSPTEHRDPPDRRCIHALPQQCTSLALSVVLHCLPKRSPSPILHIF